MASLDDLILWPLLDGHLNLKFLSNYKPYGIVTKSMGYREFWIWILLQLHTSFVTLGPLLSFSQASLCKILRRSMTRLNLHWRIIFGNTCVIKFKIEILNMVLLLLLHDFDSHKNSHHHFHFIVMLVMTSFPEVVHLEV